ncbi:hypothetical protein JN11_04457 [Mucilaginibacter frigoritolerans]|uniref:Uncharacterized protein n=1 Tax=Mucilaginibacter frigoritolerans TaxID=652788 RepID=A0A562TP74_9SPHI|nr:hypothetical protein JN11_04457 [Mucilaginibacter frigoritolerans]
MRPVLFSLCHLSAGQHGPKPVINAMDVAGYLVISIGSNDKTAVSQKFGKSILVDHSN